jgi:hypothetical protein
MMEGKKKGEKKNVHGLSVLVLNCCHWMAAITSTMAAEASEKCKLCRWFGCPGSSRALPCSTGLSAFLPVAQPLLTWAVQVCDCVWQK